MSRLYRERGTAEWGLDTIGRSADAESMAKHQPKKLPRDVNSRANAIGKIATGHSN